MSWPRRNSHGWPVREKNGVLYITVFTFNTSRPPSASIDEFDKIAYHENAVTRIDMIIGNTPHNQPYKHGCELQLVTEDRRRPSRQPRSKASSGLWFRMENLYLPIDTCLDQLYEATVQVRAFMNEYWDWQKQDVPKTPTRVWTANTPLVAILDP